MKLDIGCGKNKREGYIGIDIKDFNKVNFVINIDNTKLPFKDNSIEEIYTHHTLEHCQNIVFIMNEFFRVCKPGAKIKIIVPYGTSHQFVQDPTHKTPFNEDTFRKYFCDPNYIKAFSDYHVIGFFKEINIYIEGKDINHLELHVELEALKGGKKNEKKKNNRRI